MDLDELGRKINEKAAGLQEAIEEFRQEGIADIEAAKNDMILGEIRKLNTRLDGIEARLPDPEED